MTRRLHIARYSEAFGAWRPEHLAGSRPYMVGYYDGCTTVPMGWHRYEVRLVDESGNAIPRDSLLTPRGDYSVERDSPLGWSTVASVWASSATMVTSAAWISWPSSLTQRRSTSMASPCTLEYSTSRMGSSVA